MVKNTCLKCRLNALRGLSTALPPFLCGYAKSLLDCSGSEIVFRSAEGEKVARVVLACEDEIAPKKAAAILSIKSKNGKFDFAHYDAQFASLAKTPNKVRVAMARLEYPYELSSEMQKVYGDYLKRQAVAAGMLCIDEERMEGLRKLEEQKYISANAADKLIEYAAEKDKAMFAAELLQYKTTVFGTKKAARLSLGKF